MLPMAASYDSPTEYIQHHLTFLTQPVARRRVLDGQRRHDAHVGRPRRARRSASCGSSRARRPPACRRRRRRSSSSPSTSSTTRSRASTTAPTQHRRADRADDVRAGAAHERDGLPAGRHRVDGLCSAIGFHNFRFVPTADVNTTFALALSVFALMIFYSIKVKGLGGWIHELFCAPFGSQPAAVAVQLPVQPRRVHLEAAVALAAAVRQHVRRRDHLPAARHVGRDRPRRHDLRRRCCTSAGRSSTS